MFVLYLLNLGAASIYSIDLGAQNIRMSVSTPGKPVEIKLNERDQRLSPNYLSFPLDENPLNLSKASWIVGPDAERIYYRNQTHGIHNPFKRLWNPAKQAFRGIHPILFAATALYHHLRGLKFKNDRITMIVPSYASPQYRQHLLQASKMIGFKFSNVIDTSTAVATYYSSERIKKGSRKPITVLFVDIGAENAECSLYKFKPLGEKIYIELLQYKHSSKIGGNYIDNLLLDNVSKQISRPLVGSEPYIVLNHIRRAKERLSATDSIGIDLTEDFGKYITIDRQLVADLAQKQVQILQEMLKDIDEPEEIELIGGCSRLQLFIDTIQKAFPKIQVRRSLNSDEAAALGASYNTALHTGSMIGSKLEFKKPCLFGLNASIDGKNHLVYEPGSMVKPKKFNMIGNETRLVRQFLDLETYDGYEIDSEEFKLTTANFSDILIEETDRAVAQVADTIVNGTIPYVQVTFGISPELDIPDVIGAAAIVNVTVKKRTQAKKGHGLTTDKEVKIKFASSLNDKGFDLPPYSKKFILDVIKSDDDRRKRQESCHKIEAFIIDTRDLAEFSSEFAGVTTPDERKEIIENLDFARTQVDCTMLTNETWRDLDDQLEDLQKKFEKPLQRFEEMQKRPNALQKLNAAMARAKDAMKNAPCEQDTLDKFIQYYNETRDKINSLKDLKPLDQPEFLVKDMSEREKELLKKIAEVRRPPKKKEVINFSTANQSDVDDDEMDRLKNAGIVLGNNKKKKKDRPEEPPEIKEVKQKKYDEEFDLYEQQRLSLNRTILAFLEEQKAFQKEHRLGVSQEPFKSDGDYRRRRFLAEEKYIQHRQRAIDRRNKRHDDKQKWLEELERKRQEELNRPPTPTPTAEEAARLKKIQEEQERKRREEEDRLKRLEEERNRFKREAELIYDEEDLKAEDEEREYERYQELKKKYDKASYKQFDNDEEREKYTVERREYEQLKRKIENDPVRRRAERKKKEEAKRKKAKKEAEEAKKTELDEKFEELEADKRRLKYDLRRFEEDKRDFEILKPQILALEEKENRRKECEERREARYKARRAKQLTGFDDFESDSESENCTTTTEEEQEEVDPRPIDEELEETTDMNEDYSTTESTDTFDHREYNEAKKRVHKREAKLVAMDPKEEIKLITNLDRRRKANLFDPRNIYVRRFGGRHDKGHHEDDYSTRRRHDPPPLNPDDGIVISPRDFQSSELEETDLDL